MKRAFLRRMSRHTKLFILAHLALVMLASFSI
jgi:hypothetical protein